MPVINVKVDEDLAKRLRIIAAHTGKQYVQLLHDWITEEERKLKIDQLRMFDDKTTSTTPTKPTMPTRQNATSAEATARIMELYAKGASLQKTADALKKDGIPTKSGKTDWSLSTISDVIRRNR